MKPTQDKDINEILELLKTGLKNILGKNLIGLYLTGSLTYGDFDRGSSDIDFLAIVNRALSKKQLNAITERHKSIGKNYPEWHKRIEGQYTPLAWFDSIERPAGKRVYVNGGNVNLYPYGHEWALNYFVLYECGIALVGPDPEDLLKPVDINDVRKASNKNLLEEWLPKLKKEEPFVEAGYDTNHLQAYAIFTMCRILHRASSDEVASKRKASSWVKKTYPQWNDLVEKAENWKHGEKMEDEERIKDFIKFAVSKVLGK